MSVVRHKIMKQLIVVMMMLMMSVGVMADEVARLKEQIAGMEKQIEEYQRQIEAYEMMVLTEEQKAVLEREAELRGKVEESSEEWLDRRLEEAREKETTTGRRGPPAMPSKEYFEKLCARGVSLACEKLESLKE